MKKSTAFFLALALTLLFLLNFKFFNSFSQDSKRESVFVARVIDGDTLETKDGRTIRLLNINTPEKAHPGSQEAVDFLKQFENTQVEIESFGSDKYKRTLARIFSPEYLNLEIVKQGLATKFLVNENELSDFLNAEKFAIENENGIWKKSNYYNCFASSTLDSKNELVVLKSTCRPINFTSWIMRDESRKEYKFPSLVSDELTIHSSEGKDSGSDLFWNQKTNVWNNDRDTLYLLDKDSKIALYKPYGYN